MGLALLLLCALLLLGGGGLLQWRSALLRDLDLQRRNGKHFEQMYRDAAEDGGAWKAKYQRVKLQLEQVRCWGKVATEATGWSTGSSW